MLMCKLDANYYGNIPESTLSRKLNWVVCKARRITASVLYDSRE